jgi:Ca-activated chloride channel homolog
MPVLNVLRHSTAGPSGLISVDGKTFPLEKAEVFARAEGGIAATTLLQTYRNPHRESLEAIYRLPLPADGAVIGFTIRIGERIIRGEVERREAAHEKYRKALEEGRVGGLLEQERSDTFTQTLGNLPPGARAEVEIEVLHPLAFRSAAAGEPAHWEYRFPTVVGVRYEGEPGRVGDSVKLDVDRADAGGIPVRLSFDLVVGDATLQAGAPKSPTHPILLKALEGGARVSLAEGAPLDRDLVVCWSPLKQEVGVQLIEGPGLPGDEGRYALLAITPPARAGEIHGRDLTLLLDASGSMHGRPLALAKSVAANLLESLGPRDRFELLAFSTGIQELAKGPLEATDRNLRRALKELQGLQSGGGTEMARAVLNALKPLRSESQRQVILITDGYVGFEQEVTGKILQGLPEGARLHAVGIGAAPNRTLTRWAARAGRGVELILGDESAASAVSERLRQATVAPILTDLTVQGSALVGTAPLRPRDLFEGQPVLVALQLKPEGGKLEVCGRMAGGRETWIKLVEIAPLSQDQILAQATDPTASEALDDPGAESAKGESFGTGPVSRSGQRFGAGGRLPLGALYGREAIEDCEMQLAAASLLRDRRQFEQEIEALGLRHRIASRRTSLVAVADEPSVDPREPRRRHHLAVELPAGVSAEGVGLMAAPLEQLMRGGFETYDLGLRSRFRSQGLLEAFHQLRFGKRDEADVHADEISSPLEMASFQVKNLIRSKLVRLEKDLMVVEFDAPADGFILPGQGDDVRMSLLLQRPLPNVEVRTDETLSTRPGPHPGGLRLRLALRRTGGLDWDFKTRLMALIQWTAPDGGEIALLVVQEGTGGEVA